MLDRDDWDREEEFDLIAEFGLGEAPILRLDTHAWMAGETLAVDDACTGNRAVKSRVDRSPEERTAKLNRLAEFYEKDKQQVGWEE
jgi:hypothetical protein